MKKTNPCKVEELIKVAKTWHYTETADRVGKTTNYVRMVVKYGMRRSDVIEKEFTRVVTENLKRKNQLQEPTK